MVKLGTSNWLPHLVSLDKIQSTDRIKKGI